MECRPYVIASVKMRLLGGARGFAEFPITDLGEVGLFEASTKNI
jgi:hypothetical protein